MGSHYKAFIVVMLVTFGVFALARQVFVRWMSADDFALRRNVWFAITASAFLLPNFWLFMLVAAIIIALAAQRDTNPAALYVFLLFVVPPLFADLPTFGIVNTLFRFNHFRLLSLVLLVPVALRLRAELLQQSRSTRALPFAATRSADMLLFLFLALQLVLYLPYESSTNALRRAFLLLLDIWLPYYVVSRACRSSQLIAETMAALVLAAMVLAPISAIESLKSWLLFGSLGDLWDMPNIGYLRRDGSLRASATAGHSLVLGYFFAVALGLWLFLQRQVPRGWAYLGFVSLSGGLLAAFSRGPWLGAIVIVVTYLALGPNAFSRVIKGVTILVGFGAGALLTPLGDKIMASLPFIGTVDVANVTYREQLLRTSIYLIEQNPLFGSPHYLSQMESLRQGEGIIDIVNTYAGLALSFGLIGLALFGGFMIVTVLRCWRTVRAASSSDIDIAMIGASLIASLVGILFMLAAVSNYLSIPYVYMVLAGVATAYAELGGSRSIVERSSNGDRGDARQGRWARESKPFQR